MSLKAKMLAVNEKEALGVAGETRCGIDSLALTQEQARTEILHRLRRAEGQIRGIQRMVETGESCHKISQQLSAVRKALDSTYLRMTLCFLEQELTSTLNPSESQQEQLSVFLKEMEGLLVKLS
ncbi:MAG: hypothetical protein OHK0048_08580 [Rhodoferax sp.]